LVALIARRLVDRGPADEVFVRLGAWRLAGPALPVRHRLTVDGERDVEAAFGIGGAPSLIDGDELTVTVESDEAVDGGWRLGVVFDGIAETFTVARDRERFWVGAGGRTWVIAPSARERGGEQAAERELRAPMPGQVVAVHTSEGAEVARGDVLVVMESMKMELQITAPHDGTVAVVNVAPGDQVALDAVLAQLVPREPERLAA
jgi:acetyl-CoA/propionyl-CoA carboxylase biotin carboxyl carrier protein